VALLLAAAPVMGYEELRLRVSPEMAIEPARVIVSAYIEPNTENRAIEVITESADYYRSSFVYLEGDKAARSNTFRYRDLPAGVYEVRAVLFDREGKPRTVVRRTLTVVQ
jgi:hypothetical protein